MAGIDPAIERYLAAFFEAFPFNLIPVQRRFDVASRLNFNQLAPGYSLYHEHEIPTAVHFIIQGRIRLIGPKKLDQPTLTRLGPGDVVGWINLVRRVPTGAALVDVPLTTTYRGKTQQPTSKETLTLSLNANDFYQLAPDLLGGLSKVDRTEIFDILYRLLEDSPKEVDLTQLAKLISRIEVDSEATAVNWFQSFANTDPILSALDPEKIWFLSGGALTNRPLGTIISPTSELKQIQVDPILDKLRNFRICQALLMAPLITTIARYGTGPRNRTNK